MFAVILITICLVGSTLNISFHNRLFIAAFYTLTLLLAVNVYPMWTIIPYAALWLGLYLQSGLIIAAGSLSLWVVSTTHTTITSPFIMAIASVITLFGAYYTSWVHIFKRTTTTNR